MAADGWTLLTNHGHVLVCLANNPDMRLREVAEQVGVTERTVVSIVDDLERAGYLTRQRVGRCNHYEVHPATPLRHPVEQPHTAGELLEALLATPADAETDAPTTATGER